MDAIGPDVDVALRRQIASLPRSVFVKPTFFKRLIADADNSVFTEQCRQRPRRIGR